MRDLRSAIKYAKQQVGKNEMHRMCQGLSRTTIGVPAFGRSASIAWETCRDRGWGVAVDDGTIIPKGCIVYYSSKVGFDGHDATVGHATFCVKSGTVETAVVVSNDVGPNKEIGAVHPIWFAQHWHMRVRGYIVRCPFGPLPIKDGHGGGHQADDQQVVTPPAPDDASGVLLSNLAPGSSGPDVVALQEALIANGFDIPAGATGNYRDQTVAAVMAAQLAQGLTGADADGAVGRKTCLFLGLNVLPEPEPAQPKEMPRDVLTELLGIPTDQKEEFWDVAEAADPEAEVDADAEVDWSDAPERRDAT